MNFDGPWSWDATRQKREQAAADDRAYLERVAANKRKARQREREAQRRAEAAAIRKRNMRPIF